MGEGGEGSSQEKKSLEVRITEIENKLNELLGVGQSESKASEEDVETYKKVLRAALDDQAACGVNECSKCIVTVCNRCISVCKVCDRCISECKVCDRCISECSCGPCRDPGPCVIDPLPCIVDPDPDRGINMGRGGGFRSRRRPSEFESLGY